MLQCRRLALREWERFAQVYGQVYEAVGIPSPTNSQVLVLEEGTEIVGFVVGQLVMHVEPIWIDARHRGNPQALRMLLSGARQLFQHTPVAFAYTSMVKVGKLLEQLGFQRMREWQTFRWIRGEHG